MNPFVAHAVARKAEKAGWLDIRGGIRLFKDRRTPVMPKLGALGIGLGITVVLVALEIPLEGFVGILLPFVGEVLDLAVDGIEFILLPLLLAAAALPLILRQHPVRAEVLRR